MKKILRGALLPVFTLALAGCTLFTFTALEPSAGESRTETASVTPPPQAQTQAAVTVTQAKLNEWFPGAPQNQITVIYVKGISDFDNAIRTIRNGLTRYYVLSFDNASIGLNGINSRGSSFARESGFSPAGTVLYEANETTVVFTGRGELYLISPGHLINVSRNKTLIIDGDITLRGIQGNNLALVFAGTSVGDISSNGGLDLRSGTITGNINTEGGGGGVELQGIGTTFRMSGGAITNNTGISGGGVYINRQGGFIMSGGTISGNSAVLNRFGGFGTGTGGGVRFESYWVSEQFPYFTMTGGTISGNTAVKGGGVCFTTMEGATPFMSSLMIFNKTGGVIYGNDAPAGQRNTSAEGNTSGHAMIINPIHQNIYRDTTMNAGETLRIDGVASQLPMTGAAEKNGWTRR